jgi:hypothetical protein
MFNMLKLAASRLTKILAKPIARASTRRRQFRPLAEALEDRLAPATFTWACPNVEGGVWSGRGRGREVSPAVNSQSRRPRCSALDLRVGIYTWRGQPGSTVRFARRE